MSIFYHSKTFHLLGAEPVVSLSALNAVRDVEARLGVELPPSVREWYSIDNALEILGQYSNDDPPVPLRKLDTIKWQSKILLPFRHENQGVCTWAIHFDGSDDPPVFVDVDTCGVEWVPLAFSFSQYVYSCVWDYGFVMERPALVQAQNVPLSPSTLDKLRSVFSSVVETSGWPGSTQYRFSRDGANILIWSSDRQADWFVASADAISLQKVLEKIWYWDDVGHELYGCSPVGEEVLKRIRSI